MKPDVTDRPKRHRSKRLQSLTYGIGAGFIVYKDGRHLNRDWADKMRAYHVACIADPMGAEHLRNNQKWLAEIDAAIAGSWPEQKENAA